MSKAAPIGLAVAAVVVLGLGYLLLTPSQT